MEQTQHRNINREQRKQTVAFAVGGGIIIAVILLLTTVWVMNSAGKGTRQAVSRVSEFYLDELAGRRAQVVAEEPEESFPVYGKCTGYYGRVQSGIPAVASPFLRKDETALPHE